MPHYKDGAPARVGDYVRGTGYNAKDEQGEPRLLVGRIVSITPDSEACNCIVAFVDEIIDPQIQSGDDKLRVTDAQGQPHFLHIRTDYGETRAFEKIA